MLLLSFAQTITLVAAPAAKPPAAPAIRLTNRKDSGNRHKSSPLSDVSIQETATVLVKRVGNDSP